MSAPFRVGLLGMGRIAAGLDRPDGPDVNTHIKAIIAEPRLVLAQVADSDVGLARSEAARFGLAPMIVSPAAIVAADLDVLCIATASGSHLGYLEQAAQGGARVIVVEKPIEGDRRSRSAAVKALADRGTAVVINHFRRWIPGLPDWIAEARAGGFGRALHAVATYDRGLSNNGAHAFDLIAGFIGTDATGVHELAPAISDYAATDPTRTLAVTLATQDGAVPLIMLGCDGRLQSVFSIDLRFERARVVIFNQGCVHAELHRSGSPSAPGFAPELALAAQYADRPPRLFSNVWRNVADHLDKGTAMACAGTDALAGYDLADAIISRLRT